MVVNFNFDFNFWFQFICFISITQLFVLQKEKKLKIFIQTLELCFSKSDIAVRPNENYNSVNYTVRLYFYYLSGKIRGV